MNIAGKKVLLRALERRDAETLHRWANDPRIWRWLGGWHFPFSGEEVARWIDGLESDPLNRRFAIETSEHGLVGTANLVQIDWKNGNASQGLMIADEKLRGKGIGTDVVFSLARYAFDELRMRRLGAEIIEGNEASLALYVNRCGWREEGRQAAWYYRAGRAWDRILVGITAEEYSALGPRHWS